MWQRRTASAVFAVGVFALVASAQQPNPKPAEKKPDPVQELIGKALANDPDVRMAEAKLQLAQAELAKARRDATVRVLSLNADIEAQKRQVDLAARMYEETVQLTRNGAIPQGEMLAARAKFETAQAQLDRLRTELKLLTGDGPTAAANDPLDAVALATRLDYLRRSQALSDRVADNYSFLATLAGKGGNRSTSGPVAERLRKALDREVNLPKGDIPFDVALEVFKTEAGLDIAVRPMPSPTPVIVSGGELLPVGAWFQLYQDTAGQKNEGFAFYVREYGLLVANKQTAPPDAPTLTEFWKQLRAEKK